MCSANSFWSTSSKIIGFVFTFFSVLAPVAVDDNGSVCDVINACVVLMISWCATLLIVEEYSSRLEAKL